MVECDLCGDEVNPAAGPQAFCGAKIMERLSQSTEIQNQLLAWYQTMAGRFGYFSSTTRFDPTAEMEVDGERLPVEAALKKEALKIMFGCRWLVAALFDLSAEEPTKNFTVREKMFLKGLGPAFATAAKIAVNVIQEIQKQTDQTTDFFTDMLNPTSMVELLELPNLGSNPTPEPNGSASQPTQSPPPFSTFGQPSAA